MNKFFKLILTIIILLGLAATFYFLFMRPSGFTDQETLVSEYLINIDSEKCDTYFIEETQDICINFSDLLSEQVYTVDSLESSANEVTVTFTLNDVETTFIFVITTEEVTGIKGILTDKYYYIDTITD